MTSKLTDAVAKLNSLPSKWDFLFLGRRLQQGEVDEKVNYIDQKNNIVMLPGVVKPGFSYCLYGYALSRTGVQKLLQAHMEKNLIPVDEFVPACYMKHRRPDIAKIFKPCISAFALTEDIAFQRTKVSAGSDTEMSATWQSGK